MSLTDRLREALASAAAAAPLEGDLPDIRAEAAIPAAVLIAVTDQAEPGVLLTVRREHMRTHAGQIAFPGGRVDPGEDATAGALREAREELGLDPSNVTVIGQLAPYRTVTGYVITPIIGVAPANPPVSPHEPEVADWFEAPLDFLIDPANHFRSSALLQGVERHYYEIPWQGRRIWGATAAIIVNLSRRLQCR